MCLAIDVLRLLRPAVDRALAGVINEAEDVVDVLDSLPCDERQAAAAKLLPALDMLIDATRSLSSVALPPALPPKPARPAIPFHLN